MRNNSSRGLCVFFFTIFFLSGCSKSSFPLEAQSDLSESSETVSSKTLATQTETPLPTITATLALSRNLSYTNWPVPTIGTTQGPVVVSTINPSDEIYLYKDVKVTFLMGTDDPAIGYINLDDISDNGMGNSDIEILSATGNTVLYPTNNAKDYVSHYEKQQDYYSCLGHLSEFGMYNGIDFLDDIPFCVLTDEYRIAIVQYIFGSATFDEKNNFSMSILVTVYKQPIDIEEN